MKKGVTDVTKVVGPCGLYCGTCAHYIAPRENDVELLNIICGVTGIPVEEIRCDGCLSDRLSPLCRVCGRGFRQCAEEKNVTWCFQCPDFPCQRLKDFSDVHVVDGISHHAKVIEDLKSMKEHGVEQWAREQEKASHCPQCGKRVYWFVHECRNCHTKIR